MTLLTGERLEYGYRASTDVPQAVGGGAGKQCFVYISGSASRLVRVLRIRLTGMTLAAADWWPFTLEKWSTQPTGGTAETAVPMDSGSPASTVALIRFAPGTNGTLVGVIGSGTILFQATTPVAGARPSEQLWDLRDPAMDDAATLRGVNEGLAVCIGGSLPAGAFDGEVEWSERMT